SVVLEFRPWLLLSNPSKRTQAQGGFLAILSPEIPEGKSLELGGVRSRPGFQPGRRPRARRSRLRRDRGIPLGGRRLPRQNRHRPFHSICQRVNTAAALAHPRVTRVSALCTRDQVASSHSASAGGRRSVSRANVTYNVGSR